MVVVYNPRINVGYSCSSSEPNVSRTRQILDLCITGSISPRTIRRPEEYSLAERKRWEGSSKEEASHGNGIKVFYIQARWFPLTAPVSGSLFQFKNVSRKSSPITILPLFRYIFLCLTRKKEERRRRWLIKRVLYRRKGFFFLLLHLHSRRRTVTRAALFLITFKGIAYRDLFIEQGFQREIEADLRPREITALWKILYDGDQASLF